MPHYKAGKQEELIGFQDIQGRVSRAQKKTPLALEAIGFFWLLYYSGCRKSEAYERTAEDIVTSPDFFIIDFHQRKKHGATVDPLELPRAWPGIPILVELAEKAKQRKPSNKLLISSPERNKKVTTRVKAHWLFPHINRTWAGVIVKQILGQQYYPHFLRLNRLTELGSDPTASTVRMKSYSGIKSISALESYLGKSKKEQDAAIDFMNKQIEQKS